MTIPIVDLDPRLVPHLAADEKVFWQGEPEPSTFFGIGQLGPAAALAFAGAALGLGLLDPFFPMVATIEGPARTVPALAAIAVALLSIYTDWNRRGTLWVYAMTDRRILCVMGDRYVRDIPAAAISVEDLRIKGKVVYWARISSADYRDQAGPQWMRKGPDRPWIGFYGQTDPEATKQRIIDWRSSITREAGATALQFAEHKAEPAEARARSGAFFHRASGVALDLPEGWAVTVLKRSDGPLKVLGVTLLPRFVRESQPEPYAATADWNVLHAIGAPDLGFSLYVRSGPLDTSIERVLSDPWAQGAGLTVLDQSPSVELAGGYRGFSVTRKLTGGGSLAEFGPVAGDIALTQVWASNGRHCLEIQTIAPAGQPKLQKAVGAIVNAMGK